VTRTYGDSNRCTKHPSLRRALPDAPRTESLDPTAQQPNRPAGADDAEAEPPAEVSAGDAGPPGRAIHRLRSPPSPDSFLESPGRVAAETTASPAATLAAT
jgi:hypothetical protein